MLKAVVMDIIHLEECVLLAINHARLVLITQLNVLHALLPMLVQTEDALDHVLKELILILFQILVEHAMPHVLLVAQQHTV